MRSYLTVKEYCKKYDVPRSTVRSWIKSGTIEARRDVRPILIPDDQPFPVKDPDIHGWRYQWI